MLFDLKPKENVKDFFNYVEELRAFVGYLTNSSTRMIVVRGLRRTGKSSLLRVGLKKAGKPFILIDTRELRSISRKSFESKVLEELKSIKGIPESLMEKIEGLEAGIRISFRKDENLWKLLKKLNPIIAVDEVQMLNGTGVESFFAAAYDNTTCKIVLTGSEIGVLDAFLGKDDTKAPLFGRVYEEIKMHTLTPEKTSEFLDMGFKEAKKDIPKEIIGRALEELDGIVGWTAMFGNLALSLDPNTALKRAVTTGTKLAYSEFETFLATRGTAKNRYLALIRIIASKAIGWSDLKRSLEIELKESISDPQFTNYIHSLMDYGFVLHADNLYSIPDPLLRMALASQ